MIGKQESSKTGWNMSPKISANMLQSGASGPFDSGTLDPILEGHLAIYMTNVTPCHHQLKETSGGLMTFMPGHGNLRGQSSIIGIVSVSEESSTCLRGSATRGKFKTYVFLSSDAGNIANMYNSGLLSRFKEKRPGLSSWGQSERNIGFTTSSTRMRAVPTS
jgi:hypothetical protein